MRSMDVLVRAGCVFPSGLSMLFSMSLSGRVPSWGWVIPGPDWFLWLGAVASLAISLTCIVLTVRSVVRGR